MTYGKSDRSPYVGEVVRETEKAYLADLDEHPEEVWLPKSEVTFEGNTFWIPNWLAVDKGIA